MDTPSKQLPIKKYENLNDKDTKHKKISDIPVF
jgi:hypothetical protein